MNEWGFTGKDLVTAALIAGGALSLLRQVKQQVNGLGRKVSKLQIALLTFCAEEDREKVAKMLQ